MDDKARGLHEKFTVTRNDGSSEPGGKHHGCEYFVLDLTHDKHAEAALRAYAASCSEEHPLLAADLLHKLDGATLDEAVAKGLEWVYKREASEKAKADAALAKGGAELFN